LLIARTAFGKGAFTTLGVAGGRAQFLSLHLARLHSEFRHLPGWARVTDTPWREWVQDGIRFQHLVRGVVRLGAVTGLCAFALFERSRPTPRVVTLQMVEAESAWTGGSAKSHGYLHWRSYREQAAASGCFDVLLLWRGRLLETSRCNLFLHLGDRLVTPAELGVFRGIARQALLHHPALQATAAPLAALDLQKARQVLLVNSVRGIVRVDRVLDLSGRTFWARREKLSLPLAQVLRETA
jgi:branched-subunit amino acid aminotransferase/4-amino-4-deoxychorismate lyase